MEERTGEEVSGRENWRNEEMRNEREGWREAIQGRGEEERCCGDGVED